MSNTVNYASKYLDMLDRVYKAGAVTSILEADPNMYRFSEQNEKTIYLQTLALDGLGDYNRDTGYSDGDMTIDWEPYTLTADRSKKFKIDTLDAREAYMTIGKVGSEFQRLKVNPELDAYRFEKLCYYAGLNATPATLDYDDVMSAIRAGVKALDDAEVPKEGRVLFVSSQVEQAMEDSGDLYKSINVNSNNGVVNTQIRNFNGMDVLPVPLARFYNNFDFGSNGFTVNASGKAINFIILYKPAAIAVVKHRAMSIIDPQNNGTHDGFIYKYRIYHDLIVPTQMVNGIYVHRKA